MATKTVKILCKGLSYEQYCRFEDVRDNAVREHGENAREVGRAIVDFVLKEAYPDVDTSQLTFAEVWAIVNRTLELSGAIREEEIKNLRPLSDGSTNEAATAKTAEK